MALPQQSSLSQVSETLVNDFRLGAGQRLEDQVTDAGRPSLQSVTDEVTTAGEQSGRSFDVAEGVRTRQLSRLGQSQTAREKASAKRRLGLGRALGSVDAKNRAIEGIEQRADIARSGAASLQSIVEGQQLDTLSTTAGIETQREAQFIRDRAERKAKKRAGLGQIAGIGLTIATGGAAGLALGAAGAL